MMRWSVVTSPSSLARIWLMSETMEAMAAVDWVKSLEVTQTLPFWTLLRSEERRVGKEC